MYPLKRLIKCTEHCKWFIHLRRILLHSMPKCMQAKQLSMIRRSGNGFEHFIVSKNINIELRSIPLSHAILYTYLFNFITQHHLVN